MTSLDIAVSNQVPVLSLEERRDTLAVRLEVGYQKIEEAHAQGKDTTRWEEGWLRLLDEYEQVCDQIARRPLKKTA